MCPPVKYSFSLFSTATVQLGAHKSSPKLNQKAIAVTYPPRLRSLTTQDSYKIVAECRRSLVKEKEKLFLVRCFFAFAAQYLPGFVAPIALPEASNPTVEF